MREFGMQENEVIIDFSAYDGADYSTVSVFRKGEWARLEDYEDIKRIADLKVTISVKQSSPGGCGDAKCVSTIPVTFFEDWSNLKEVNIAADSGIKNIDDKAFSGCGRLTSIMLPASITSIGERAFFYCESLTSITLPDSITNIGDGAFASCCSLRSITLPASITSIGDGAFFGCGMLTSITLPASITSIGDYAFFGCGMLTSITLPDSITSIGARAFEHCESLKSIRLPVSITSIGDSAFIGCRRLTSITLPASITSISNGAFLYCESLTSITLPVSITSISDCAFADCRSLTSITLPASITSIGDGAFEHCESLKSIRLPASITSIGDWAFRGCESLTSITLPNSITSIGAMAFRDCESLESITLPDSITSIGDYAFDSCSNLKYVIAPQRHHETIREQVGFDVLIVESESCFQILKLGEFIKGTEEKYITAKIDQDRAKKDGEVNDFLCPISQELMENPVTISGIRNLKSYERSEIAKWFDGGRNTSPISREPVPGGAGQLVDNTELQEKIERYQEGLCGELRQKMFCTAVDCNNPEPKDFEKLVVDLHVIQEQLRGAQYEYLTSSQKQIVSIFYLISVNDGSDPCLLGEGDPTIHSKIIPFIKSIKEGMISCLDLNLYDVQSRVDREKENGASLSGIGQEFERLPSLFSSAEHEGLSAAGSSSPSQMPDEGKPVLN